MKNYEEMAQNVLRRIDEYENEKRIRRTKITKAAASVTPVCAAAVIGIGLWKGGVLTPEQDQLISSTGDNAAYDVIVPEETVLQDITDPFREEKAYDAPVTTADTTEISVSAATQSGEEITEVSRNDDPASGGDIPEADLSVPDKTPAPRNEQPVMTKPAVQQTSPAVQNPVPPVQTAPPVQNTEPPVQTAPAAGSRYMWCIAVSSLEWNGTVYHDNDMAKVSAYTQDRYIGRVGDFEGVYGGADVHPSYRIAPEDSVYTVKGTDDVLLVVKADSDSPYGAVIVMSSSDWSLEKYEPWRLDPYYIDPDTPDDPAVYFGLAEYN